MSMMSAIKTILKKPASQRFGEAKQARQVQPLQCAPPIFRYPTEKRNWPTLKIGSDCTGLNAAAFALENLCVPFDEVFASDSDPHVRSVLKSNFPKLEHKLFDNIMTRPISPKKLDLYTAGFPCQSFSNQGYQQGMNCANGEVALHVMDYLIEAKPTSFILENVAALVQPQHKQDFDTIMGVLTTIPGSSGQPFYRVVYHIVDPTDVGMPQSRRRLFIVGVARDKERKTKRFMFPGEKAFELMSLSEVLDSDQSHPPELPQAHHEQKMFVQSFQKIYDLGGSPRDDWIVDLSGQSVSAMNSKCPCLTRSHCGNLGYFSTKRCRKLRLGEMMRLQGFDPTRLVYPQVSERQVRLMVGNAFCVPVVAAIIDRILFATGKTTQPLTFVYGKKSTDVPGSTWSPQVEPRRMGGKQAKPQSKPMKTKKPATDAYRLKKVIRKPKS